MVKLKEREREGERERERERESLRNRVNMINRETWFENSGGGFIHSSTHLRDGDKERDSP